MRNVKFLGAYINSTKRSTCSKCNKSKSISKNSYLGKITLIVPSVGKMTFVKDKIYTVQDNVFDYLIKYKPKYNGTEQNVFEEVNE